MRCCLYFRIRAVTYFFQHLRYIANLSVKLDRQDIVGPASINGDDYVATIRSDSQMLRAYGREREWLPPYKL